MPWEGICFEFKGSQVTSGHPGWLAYRQKLLEPFLFNDVFLLRLLRNVASMKFLFVENLFYNLYLISLPLKPFNQHVCVTGLKISAGAPSAEAKMFWIWHADTLQITVQRRGLRMSPPPSPVNMAAACSVNITLLNIHHHSISENHLPRLCKTEHHPNVRNVTSSFGNHKISLAHQLSFYISAKVFTSTQLRRASISPLCWCQLDSPDP